MDPESLLGRWRLRRRLIDRRTGIRGQVRGELRVEADGEGLRWAESGELTWDALVVPVQRTYGLEPVDGLWWMTFEDGRLFHRWTPGAWVTHDCAADVYRGFVDLDRGRLRTLWDVEGPTKSQRIATRFTRSG